MLAATGGIDVIIPRRLNLWWNVFNVMPACWFAHLEGILYSSTYAADLEKARAIIVNAKMRRVGICGAAGALGQPSMCRRNVASDR